MADAVDPIGNLQIREPRLRERLAVLLACEIVGERLSSPSSLVSAEQIASRYGVSAMVAREAVQILSMVGLVRVQHGKRTLVESDDQWDVLSPIVQEAYRREGKTERLVADFYEFRILIEPTAAYRMATQASPRQILELERVSKTISELATEADRAGDVLRLDSQYHNMIASASGNQVLRAITRDIREVLETVWALSRLNPSELLIVAEQHARITQAIAKRRPSAAADAMRTHLDWASRTDLSRFREPTSKPSARQSKLLIQ